MSNRYFDSQAEQELAKFMDEFFYPRLKGGRSIEFKRIHDKALQLSGIDVQLLSEKGCFNFDEKAQLDYLSNPLPTFAFELLSLQNGNLRCGWFTNEQIQTHYYVLIYPNARCGVTSRNVKKEDFTQLDVLIVSREKLIARIGDLGFSIAKLNRFASELWRQYKYKNNQQIIGSEKDGIKQPCYFAYSGQKDEKPINLVVRKKMLEELASRSYRVTKAEVRSMK